MFWYVQKGTDLGTCTYLGLFRAIALGTFRGLFRARFVPMVSLLKYGTCTYLGLFWYVHVP